MIRHAAAAALLALTLAGCARVEGLWSDGDATPRSSAASPSTGPVAQPAIYPDGLTVTVDKVTKLARSRGAYTKPDQELIQITLGMINTGPAAIPLPEGYTFMDVYYGPNRVKADPDPGYMGDDVDSNDQDPTQVGPGQTVQVVEAVNVPVDQLSAVSVTFILRDGSRQPWTWDSVETLIR